jgi:hypothetical protein
MFAAKNKSLFNCLLFNSSALPVTTWQILKNNSICIGNKPGDAISVSPETFGHLIAPQHSLRPNCSSYKVLLNIR